MPRKKDDWVRLGDLAIQRIGMQCQYASHYLRDPEFQWVRWEERHKGDYHSIYMHPDDADRFVEQVKTIRRELG